MEKVLLVTFDLDELLVEVLDLLCKGHILGGLRVGDVVKGVVDELADILLDVLKQMVVLASVSLHVVLEVFDRLQLVLLVVELQLHLTQLLPIIIS